MPSNSNIILFLIAGFAFIVFFIYAYVRVYVKAGEKWWAALVPIYNLVVLARIADKPWYWGILAGLGLGGQSNKNLSQAVSAVLIFLTLVSVLFSILVGVAIAKRFKRSTLFGVFLLGIFSFIGYPILGYGKSTYDKNIST